MNLAESGGTATFPMIAKGFIPEMGTKPFAIMKGSRECELFGALGAGAIIHVLTGRGASMPAAAGGKVRG
jgi:hypothetical protein